jgi:predicted ATP-grasp superfamily ATP-dependent carboligase
MREEDNYNGRVILTYGRSLMALTAAHSLGRRGIEVVGCDDVDMTVLQFSRYTKKYFVHPSYEHDPQAYLDRLEEKIIEYKPDDGRPYVLMPMFSDAKLLAKHRDRFEQHITLAAPHIDSIDAVAGKVEFARLCQKLDLPMPETHIIEDANALDNIKDDLDYPVLLKTPASQGGRGIDKCHSAQELEEIFKKNQQKHGSCPVVQAMIGGEDYCFTALAKNGEILASMAYTNLYQFPKKTGSGIMRETVDDAPFRESAVKILKETNWTGVAEIDFRWSEKAEDPAYLIELNARYWAGLFHSVVSGVDYPWLSYKLVTEGTIGQAPDVKIGRKTKVPGLWAMSALQEVLENEQDWDKVKEAWAGIWQRDDPLDWKAKWSRFSDAFQHFFSEGDMRNAFKQMRTEGKEAVSELDFEEDDPLTSLGILFIASSLVRHGKLPPEVRH